MPETGFRGLLAAGKKKEPVSGDCGLKAPAAAGRISPRKKQAMPARYLDNALITKPPIGIF